VAESIFVLGDLHFPYHHKGALKAVLNAIKAAQPTHIVQIGDLYDFFSATKFPKKTFIDPADEYMSGYDYAQEMWATIRRLSPNSKCYQIKGNHDERPAKRMIEKLPDLIFFLERGIKSFFEFEGVHTVHDPAEPLVIWGINFIHGYLGKLGAHAQYFRQSVVCGHTHRAGVYVEQCNDDLIFEANCGFLADETKEALKYRPTKTSKWTRTLLVIHKILGKPCPMIINLHGEE
jgi:UDP-2,3-diacylglucosamine pyrophosphatase LpxH